jgi:hypothetical protein
MQLSMSLLTGDWTRSAMGLSCACDWRIRFKVHREPELKDNLWRVLFNLDIILDQKISIIWLQLMFPISRV